MTKVKIHDLYYRWDNIQNKRWQVAKDLIDNKIFLNSWELKRRNYKWAYQSLRKINKTLGKKYISEETLQSVYDGYKSAKEQLKIFARERGILKIKFKAYQRKESAFYLKIKKTRRTR